MSPLSTKDNILDCTPGNTILSPQRCDCVTGGIKRADLPNVVVSKFGMGFLLSTRAGVPMAWPTGHPALIGGISHIVGVSTEPEVVRANTGGHIATMAHLKTLWYRAIMKFVGKAMGKLMPSFGAEYSVAASDFGGSPEPAGIRFVDFGPEPLNNGAYARIMPDHKAYRLPLYMTILGVVPFSNWCGRATSALAKFGAVERKLEGWYNLHVKSPVLRFGRTGDVSASPGFPMPNYTTFVSERWG